MAKKIDFKHNLGLYLGLLKRHKTWLFGILAVIFILEGSRILDKLLFKLLIDKGTELSAGSILQNEFVQIGIIVAASYIVIFSVRSVLKWVKINMINEMDARMIIALKKRFFNHIVHLSHKFHTTHKTGSLISRLTRGGGALETMTDVIVFNVAPLLFQFIVAAVSLWYFDKGASITIAATVIAFITYSVILQRIQEPLNVAMNDAEDVERANIGDIFMNIESVKYFGKEAVVKSKFAQLSERTKASQLKTWGIFRWIDAGQTLILGVGTVLLVYFPIVSFLNGNATIGTVAFIFTVYATILGPMFGFVHGIRNFFRAMADFESLFIYDKVTNEVKETKDAKECVIKKPEIEFRDVTFRYGKRNLLENFSLRIPENKKVALVGHSGSGKSTLIKLLYRLYDIHGGEILVDGNNINQFKKESLRSELSIVPQECVLFDDTIYNNIKFSNPQATREEVMRAMKFAQLDKIVANFPKKERTIVGERGVKLSGGEKQRVSIARALLANKKVLVLDEATSALDSETEHEIQQDLERLMEGRTSIIIAHRLSTIMKADKIVVLDNGKIVQTGTHESLIKRPGQYKKLWNLQKGGYIK